MAGMLAGQVAVALAVAPAGSSIANRPDAVQFARAHIGDFEVVAQTAVEWRNDEPYPGNVTCVAHASALKLQVGRMGSIDFSLGDLGDPPSSRSWSFSDIAMLQLGQQRYELGTITVPQPTGFFSDVSYREPQISTADFRGWWAFRRSPADPWMRTELLVPELIKARTTVLTIRGWDRDKGPGPNRRAVRLHINGIREAIKWCQVEVQAKASSELHASNVQP